MEMDKCKWLIQRHNQDIHGSHTQENYVQTTSHLSQFLAIFRQEMKKRKKRKKSLIILLSAVVTTLFCQRYLILILFLLYRTRILM